jgi:hypothetical protein
MTGNFKPYPWQDECLRRFQTLPDKQGLVVAAPPGAGKTFAGLRCLLEDPFSPHVVIAPPGTVSNQWVTHAQRLGLTAKVVRKPADAFGGVWVVPWSVLSMKTSGDLLAAIRELKPGVLLVDESHYAKACGGSRRGRVMMGDSRGKGLRHAAPKTLALTGTPVLSSGPDIRAQLLLAGADRIDPVVGNRTEYEAKYWGGKMAMDYAFGGFRWMTSDFIPDHMKAEHDRLMSCFLRVSQAELDNQLPMHTRDLVIPDGPSGPNIPDTALAAWTTAAMNGIEAVETYGGRTMREVRVESSLSRLPAAKALIESWSGQAGEGRGLIVWVYYHDTAAAIAGALETPWIITGSLDPKQRAKRLDEAYAARARVIVATSGSAGTGIDGLQRWISRQMFLELPFNPGGIEQTEGRIVRTGQAHTVWTTWLISGIELRLAQGLARKSKIIESVLNIQ